MKEIYAVAKNRVIRNGLMAHRIENMNMDMNMYERVYELCMRDMCLYM